MAEWMTHVSTHAPTIEDCGVNGSLCVTQHPLANATLEELLKVSLGGRYRNLTESIILTLVYSLIFITGVVGNVCTCIVIIKNSSMHTATNYYLFSLAISDVLTLILGLPPELYTIWEAYPWRLGEPYCLFKTFLTEMTSCASILTITAFTVERYVAICHPIRAQRMSSLSRAIKIIAVIWISACITALPYPIHTRTYYYVSHPVTDVPLEDSLICNIPAKWVPNMRHVFQMSTFLLFVTPMTVISVLYIMIGLTLRKSALVRHQSSDISGSPPQSQSRRAVLKMLVAVVVAFFICWAPFHAQRLMTVYVRDDQWTTTLLEIQSVLFYISGVLYFVSSTVNPILYNLMSRKYRQAFKETLCRCCLTEAERNPWLNGGGGRSRYYTGADRSTYSTTAQSTRIPASSVREHGATATGLKASLKDRKVAPHVNGNGKSGAVVAVAVRDTFGSKKQPTNNNRDSDRVSWKDRLFKLNKKQTKSTAQTLPLNGMSSLKDHRAAAGNGSCSSASSSPGVMAAHIKEEMEMSSILLSEEHTKELSSFVGDADSGTML